MLSFYLRGIPFVDLVHLRKTDMKHNTIYYYRRKTRQQLSVYLEPYAAEILRRYTDKHSPSPYLLPYSQRSVRKATGSTKAHCVFTTSTCTGYPRCCA